MKKTTLGTFLFIIIMGFTACGTQSTADMVDPTPEITQSITEVPIEAKESKVDNKDTEKNTPTPTLSPIPASYKEYVITDEISVLFQTDTEKKEVIIRNSAAKEWKAELEYDLSYGDPIIYYIEKETAFASYPILYVGLPQQECEAISPIGARELCGAWYEVRYNTVDKTMTVEQMNDETISESFEQFFTLKVKDGHLQAEWLETVFDYPAIEMKESNEIEPVIESVLHITDTMLSYRRVGINMDNEVLWIGKLWDTVSSVKKEQNFIPDMDVQYGENATSVYEALQTSGEWIMAEPDDCADLDGDGIKENISYRKMVDGVGKNAIRLYINEKETSFMDEAEGFHLWQMDSVFYLISMDGETMQLAFKTWEGANIKYVFYQYEKEQLSLIGWMPGLEFVVSGHNENGGVILSARFTDAILLQNYATSRSFEYVSGKLQEIKQDFYEFYHGNTITAKEALTLYKQQGEAQTIIFPAGSSVYIIGSSDLKEWVLLENAQTGDRGWLRMKSETECELPGGDSINSTELFDGLWFGS